MSRRARTLRIVTGCLAGSAVFSVLAWDLYWAEKIPASYLCRNSTAGHERGWSPGSDDCYTCELEVRGISRIVLRDDETLRPGRSPEHAGSTVEPLVIVVRRYGSTMANAKHSEHTYRCWYKLAAGKHCPTYVAKYGERCKAHRYLW